MLKQICVDHTGMDGMDLNVAVFILTNQQLQMAREQHLGQFTLIVCIGRIIIIAAGFSQQNKKQYQYQWIFNGIEMSDLRAIDVVHIDVAQDICAR